MAKLFVKKDDRVEIMTGKDKGKRGKILRALPDKDRIVVEAVNLIKRHTKATQRSPQGGIVEREAPIHVSNVMLVCPSCGEPTRVAHRLLEEGGKVRVCKKCEVDIDKA